MPLRSRGWSLKRVAAIAGLVELIALDHGAHGAVEDEDALLRFPLQRCNALFPGHCAASFGCGEGLCRAKPQQMADGIDEVGAVQRVEMKLGDALIDEAEDLLCGDGRRDEMLRVLVVLKALEATAEPVRHARPRPRRKARDLLEIMDGDETGHDRHGDTGGAHAVEIAEEHLVVEEELGDGRAGAGVDLGLQ